MLNYEHTELNVAAWNRLAEALRRKKIGPIRYRTETVPTRLIAECAEGTIQTYPPRLLLSSPLFSAVAALL